MHKNYKLEERVIKNIITENTQCISAFDQLNVIFYYDNNKSRSFVMKNNSAPKPSKSDQTNLDYCFTCPFNHHLPEKYIGKTQKTLASRMQSHIYRGSIKDHLIEQHNVKPTLDLLLDNSTILALESDSYRLTIKESLLILHLAPSINRQFNNFSHTLKLKPNRDVSDLNIRLSQINNSQNNNQPTNPANANSTDNNDISISTEQEQINTSDIDVAASANPVTSVHARSMAHSNQADVVTDIPNITSFSYQASPSLTPILSPNPTIGPSLTPILSPNPTIEPFYSNNFVMTHNVSPNIESRINSLINAFRSPDINVNTLQTPRRLRPRNSRFKYTQ